MVLEKILSMSISENIQIKVNQIFKKCTQRIVVSIP